MNPRARALWLVATALVVFVAVTVGNVLYTNSVEARGRAQIERVQREQQRDLCDMIKIFDDPTAPAPATERGQRQVAAIRAYLARRC